jgi:hypothetical protein
MSREETFDSICVLLEEYASSSLEIITEHLLDYLEITGEDLLDHLEPPLGLRRWLDSHGLSLVVTREVTPPVVWDAIAGEDEEPVEGILEGEPGDLPPLQVGGYVEYRTAPAGPHGASQVGSGFISEIGDGYLMVDVIGSPLVYLDTSTDFIRVVSP